MARRHPAAGFSNIWPMRIALPNASRIPKSMPYGLGDGSSVITKQPGTGGVVTVGTVTAQLLYEIAEPGYVNPDVIARFDTIAVTQQGRDRVAVTGMRGEPAPDRTKVAITYPGGYRNTMTMVVTGLDIEAKAARAEAMLWEILGGKDRFAAVDVRLVRTDRPDAPTNEEATALLRITVKDPDESLVGRAFSNAVTQLALASYAGFFTLTPPGGRQQLRRLLAGAGGPPPRPPHRDAA